MKEKIRRAIVSPDKHFPLADIPAINVLCKVIKFVKPEIYIDLGDTGEWEAFSTHYWKGRSAKPVEDLIPLLDSDVEEVNNGMDQIDASLDKVGCNERHFIQGNHERWLDKFVIRHPYLPQYKVENALRLEERGYQYHPYTRKKLLNIGKLYFGHGKFTVKYHAWKHLDHYGKSVMYGHTHDLQRYTHTNLDGTRSSWSLGCLKNIEHDEDWLEGKLTNWNHAFAIIDFFENDDFKVEVVEIIGGRTTVWGEYFNGN